MPREQRLLTGYVPNLGLTCTSIALFGILAVIYWTYFARHGQKYMLTLCISMVAMTIGCGVRVRMTSEPGSLGVYIGTQFLTLLSPCGFIATNYIVLPRLATHISSEDCLFLPPRRIVRIFVWSDVITFLLQGGGSGVTAMNNGTVANIGKYVTLVGLGIQFLSFGAFSALLIVFGYRVRSVHPRKWVRDAPRLRHWTAVYYALIWASVGIIIRSIFRIAEYAQGYDGYLRTTEWCLYIFDSLPLFCSMCVWSIIWPPKFMMTDYEHSAYSLARGVSVESVEKPLGGVA